MVTPIFDGVAASPLSASVGFMTAARRTLQIWR